MWKIKLLIPCNEGRTRNSKKLITIRQDTLRPINSWLKSHCAGNYRLLKTWRKTHSKVLNAVGKKPRIKNKIVNSCHFTIFINNEAEYLNIINQFDSMVIITFSPANKSHEELIRDGNIIDVKDNLYFDKFRYKISFWGGSWNRRWSTKQIEILSVKDIQDLITSHLHNDSIGIDDQEYCLITFNKSLYIKNKGDYTLIKLAMGEYIKKITVIALPNEVLSELIV
jgi:hypothetical protein